ncbi:hypothetical protein FQN54_004817 [Arachnomyces sp. PD_36]|nr:hypothetical protein FQN54_004817 [Arachnomyces sp. PD_36]
MKEFPDLPSPHISSYGLFKVPDSADGSRNTDQITDRISVHPYPKSLGYVSVRLVDTNGPIGPPKSKSPQRQGDELPSLVEKELELLATPKLSGTMSSSWRIDPSLPELRHLIKTHPLIDNHAHNLLNHETALNYHDKYPLECIVSEAHGEKAVEQSRHALAHIRAVRQLSEFLGCTPHWDAVKETRDKLVRDDYEGFVRRCFVGTHTALIDDGLVAADVAPYDWHDQFTTAPCKRIVRIEELAVDIIRETFRPVLEQLPKDEAKRKAVAEDQSLDMREFLVRFTTNFISQINAAVQDSEVVGFKSIVCYRTGLKLDRLPYDDHLKGFEVYFRNLLLTGKDRVEHKPFNDFLVFAVLDVLRESPRENKKPIQFHTGLGDSDIDLLLSNPAHLQQTIEEYPGVDFVILHSSYPYTRDAGYLATVYPNAYLDIGEVFPMVSRDAQESIIRQSLELAPVTKLLWSTDGHYFPETYWLANVQFRDALDKILVSYVTHGDMDAKRAMDAAAKIMFNNSNELYSLNLESGYQPLSTPSRDLASTKPSTDSITPSSTGIPELGSFLAKNPSIEFIWMQWVDYTATVRLRMFPLREFIKVATNQRKIGITTAVLYLLQDDNMVPGGRVSGIFNLEPDLSSLYLNAGLPPSAAKSASVMSYWRDDQSNELEQRCPRTTLSKLVSLFKSTYDISFLFGFEIEIVFMKPTTDDSGNTNYSPSSPIHSWSNMTSTIRSHLPILEEIARTLQHIGISLEQFHSESAPGQFEFCLPPSPPLHAIDTLIKTRQTITNITERHGLRATLYPRPFAKSAGSASHAHISINPASKAAAHETAFLAGILSHLPSITAFTLPLDESYARVQSGAWGGSEWVAWGTQNREAPVRKISTGRWEIKCVDGVGNMYLNMSAILAAGYIGIRDNIPLTWKDCADDPQRLSDTQRGELGITRMMPKGIEESVGYLEGDGEMVGLLGEGFVRDYVNVRRVERGYLGGMGEGERRKWLIERY